MTQGRALTSWRSSPARSSAQGRWRCCWSEHTRRYALTNRSAWLSAMSPPAVAPTRPELPEQLEQIELTALEHDLHLAELELTGGPSLADQRARGVTFQLA